MKIVFSGLLRAACVPAQSRSEVPEPVAPIRSGRTIP